MIPVPFGIVVHDGSDVDGPRAWKLIFYTISDSLCFRIVFQKKIRGPLLGCRAGVILGGCTLQYITREALGLRT